MAEFDLVYEAARSLGRLRPGIHRRIEAVAATPADGARLAEAIERRLDAHWLRFFRLLHQLYGDHYDFFYYLERILMMAVDCWLERPHELQELDRRRENDPGWYLSERMAGMSLYVDLFNGDLNGLCERIPYLKDLGISYLHLMPLFASRPENSDGGYAVSDYRTVDPHLGTMAQLREAARELREVGISLVLDFVFNHTSDDHEWAVRAQEGEREFLDYYFTFPDRTLPDAYERTLREIFPTIRRGNFTWHAGLRRWVWTTFNSFQWDLNYGNPEVFRAMAGEMLFLANSGVELLRLDAVAFIWKRMGTNCENLPEAHLLIQAFNALCRIAAPALAFKSEAIVHPDEVARYIGEDECQLSYNPTLMALLWESVATRRTALLERSLSHRHAVPENTVWVNYLRGHDDIGWSFDDGDAWSAGIDPHGHRDFLNRFYTGRFQGTFASGVPFQHNEDTGDMRVSGTMASLAGLEQAMRSGDAALVEMALRRIRLLHGVLASIGGVPVIFMGDEWGLLNDYGFADDPDKQDDSRWVHRNRMDWDLLAEIDDRDSVRRRIFCTIQDLLRARRETPALAGTRMELLEAGNPHVLAYLRQRNTGTLVVIANFSDAFQWIGLGAVRPAGLGGFLRDVLTGREVATGDRLELEPYELLWLSED